MSLTRETIVATALELVEGTAGGLSLRGLAAVLGVTPMALYPHIGDLDGLLEAMAERCFTEDAAQDKSNENPNLRERLLWYCGRVLRYPSLTSAIVARHGGLPVPHQAWTDAVTRCVSDLNLPLLWRDILVDHLHGFALVTAANGAELEAALAVYAQHVDLLLGCISGGTGMADR
ncbi:MAG: TetR/AcrR family transcriptional regulator [Burkholderiaceae bacterium]|nr:TetR/AcrR family transcriptional regulator [Burkholderiaceae bacterium]